MVNEFLKEIEAGAGHCSVGTARTQKAFWKARGRGHQRRKQLGDFLTSPSRRETASAVVKELRP